MILEAIFIWAISALLLICVAAALKGLWNRWKQPVYEVDRLLPVKSADFQRQMGQAADFIINYLGTLRDIPVRIQQEPGFLYRHLDKNSPSASESFDEVLRNLNRDIMPFIGHWLHPQWHAYFPSGCSFADIVADAIASSLGVVQFSWDAAPAFTELEIKMVNWLGRAIGLSEEFLFDDSVQGSAAKGKGGGAFQPSSSDAVFVAMMAARYKKIRELVPIEDADNPPADVTEKEAAVLGRMVVYFSIEAHSCYLKATKMCMVQYRLISTNDDFTMRMDDLEGKIKEDRAKNLAPFLVGCTSGTTSTAAFDDLRISPPTVLS